MLRNCQGKCEYELTFDNNTITLYRRFQKTNLVHDKKEKKNLKSPLTLPNKLSALSLVFELTITVKKIQGRQETQQKGLLVRGKVID